MKNRKTKVRVATGDDTVLIAMATATLVMLGALARVLA